MELACKNILSNARQAMNGQGVIEIVSSASNAHRVQLEFRDTGQGMVRDEVARAFDPFFTSRDEPSGMGLGLSVAHGIVRSHGGALTLESRAGRGTMVRMTLPVEAVSESPEEGDHNAQRG